MTAVKEMVFEISHFCTSSSLSPTVTSTHLSLTIHTSPIQTYPSTQPPGAQVGIPGLMISPSPHTIHSSIIHNPPSPCIANIPVNITPTQASHYLHQNVQKLIQKSTSLADAALTNAMETTLTSTYNSLT